MRERGEMREERGKRRVCPHDVTWVATSATNDHFNTIGTH